MAILPPFDPSPTGRGGQSSLDDDVEYVSQNEAYEEDRVTFLDKLAIFGAIAVAQLIRLGIIAAAVGIIVLVIFIGSKI